MVQGFTKRDYIVASVIIVGVVGSWFLLMATLFGLIKADYSLPILVLIGFIIYRAIKTKPGK